MKKELKDYLHLYLGCECVFDSPSICIYIKGKLSAVTKGGSFQLEGDGGSWAIVNDLKLILRPLSDMTAEYANELWGHLELNGDFMMGNGYRRKGYILKAFLDNYFEDIDDVWDFDLLNRASMKLRKNEFDCDGLIEAGLAIDKTTLKTNS